MASFDLTVEDCSPLILYSPAGAWADATDDPLLSSYSGNSFHSTSSQGATATINFNGTGISIFGGMRANYGTYSITVDGQTVTSGSATSQQESFKQLLGSASGLTNGPHTAVLTNSGASSIDIDFIDITSQIGAPGSQVTNTTIDDNDAQMSYQPPEVWQLNSNDGFMNNSLHFTNDSTATASVSFSGDAVAIWGTVSPDHANLRVTLDGQTRIFNAGSGGNVAALHSQTLLFFANDLGSAQHTLVISPDQEADTGLFVDLDAVQVFSVTTDARIDPSAASTQATGSPSTSSSAISSADKVASRRTMPASVIASIIVGVLAGLLVIGVLIFLLLRRRRRRMPPPTPKASNNEKPGSPKTPDLPIQLEGGFRTPIDELPTLPELSARMQQQRFTPSFPAPKSRESTYTILSYYTESSTTSSAPMLPRNPKDVPIIRAPRAPRQLTPNGRPARPSQRPPTLELPG